MRPALAWMAIAEMILVAVLVVVAWNVVPARPRTAVKARAAALPAAAAQDGPTVRDPLLTIGREAGRALLSGLRLNRALWRQRLDRLKHDAVFFEQLEWRLVQTAVDAWRDLETRVVAFGAPHRAGVEARLG
jgi:hypothetical protein